MTTQQLQATGFIVNFQEKSIEEVTYRNYLNEYGRDETTTPRGIGDRLHTREVELEDGSIEYQMWTWGVGGNHPSHCGPDFDNAEDAELYYYERSEWYVSEKNWDAPRFHSTYKEAMQDLADSFERSIEVVVRYLAISAITARKNAEHRAKVTAEYEQRKAWLAIEVPKEADRIAIDQQFKDDITAATLLSSKAKSKACEMALSSLLNRLGVKIITDFWQVLRVLKSKV